MRKSSGKDKNVDTDILRELYFWKHPFNSKKLTVELCYSELGCYENLVLMDKN